jgi:hypothetical protein
MFSVAGATALAERPDVTRMASPLTIHTLEAPSNVRGFATRLQVDPSILDGVTDGDVVVMEGFPLDQSRFVTLRLQERSPLAPDARYVVMVADRRGRPVEQELPWPKVHVFSGSVDGDPESDVYLAIGTELVNGWITIDGTRYLIGTRVGIGDQEHATLIYDEKNIPSGMLDFSDSKWKCGTKKPVDTSPPVDGGFGEQRASNPDCRQIAVAIDTDQQYLYGSLYGVLPGAEGIPTFGGNTTLATEYAQMLQGAVSDLYTDYLGVELVISYFRLWTVLDPWNAVETESQIAEFNLYWTINMGHVDRGLAHLWSGRNLGGGIASLNAICTTSGYAVMGGLAWGGGFDVTRFGEFYDQWAPSYEDGFGPAWDPVVVAHETGHNFGMIHTFEMEDPPDQCGEECGDDWDPEADGFPLIYLGTIMSYCHLCTCGPGYVPDPDDPENPEAPGVICPDPITNIRFEFMDENLVRAANQLADLPCDMWGGNGDPPTAVDDWGTCEKTGTADVYVLENDFSNDCSTLNLSDWDITSLRGGSIEAWVTDGNELLIWNEDTYQELGWPLPDPWIWLLQYQAPGDITGTDAFHYTAADASGRESRARVVITIPIPPVTGGGDHDFDIDDIIHLIVVWGGRSADWDGDGDTDGDDFVAILDGQPKRKQ